MSKISNKSREKAFKGIAGVVGGIDHQKYISRITKSFYYSKLPKNEQLSLPVTELAAELFSETQQGKSLNRLHCDDAAKISRSACVSPCSLVLALIYLEKLKTCDPEYLERTSPSELFLVSLMVSCKFLFDDGESEEVFFDEWAASGGISRKRLIVLEKEFLEAINWEIFVNGLSFWKKLSEMEREIAKKQGIARGYFTYTELVNLLGTIQLGNLVQCFVAISAILTATYAAGFLTIIGAVFITSHIPGNCIHHQRHLDLSRQIALNTTTELEIPNQIHNKSIEKVSWDWWSAPTMEWLSSQATASTTEQSLNEIVDDFDNNYYLQYFLYISSVNLKHLDYKVKSTKTRIQDQLETSWHEEWTDSFLQMELIQHNLKS